MSLCCINYYVPAPMKWWVHLSVRPSVACFDLTQEWKGLWSPKLAWWKHMGNPCTYLEVKRSKIKVTRPINGVIANVSYACQQEFAWCKGESESIFYYISNRTIHRSGEFQFSQNCLVILQYGGVQIELRSVGARVWDCLLYTSPSPRD